MGNKQWSIHEIHIIQKGFWRINDKNKIEIVGFELIETSLLSQITKEKKIVDYHEYIAYKQNEFALKQKPIACKQTNSSKGKGDNQPQEFAHKQTVSSITDVRSYKDGFNNLKTDEEYKKIKDEESDCSLSIDDMKLIDLTAHEDPNIPS